MPENLTSQPSNRFSGEGAYTFSSSFSKHTVICSPVTSPVLVKAILSMMLYSFYSVIIACPSFAGTKGGQNRNPLLKAKSILTFHFIAEVSILSIAVSST